MLESDLARFLGCQPEVLPKVGLCRRPDPDSPEFQSDVRRIADALGLQADRLVQLVRETDALNALGKASPSVEQKASQGFLMAARDSEAHESARVEAATESDRGQGQEEETS
jgi:hypothetical protein